MSLPWLNKVLLLLLPRILSRSQLIFRDFRIDFLDAKIIFHALKSVENCNGTTISAVRALK